MADQTKILVVNADGFGASETGNRAIVKSFREGIVRSTSLMPNGHAFEDAVRHALETPGLGVGVHLTLVGEKCVAPASELGAMVAKDGSLPETYSTFARDFMARRFGVGEVHAEIRAQIDRVLATDIVPTHIDSSQHLHMLPAIFDLVLSEAAGSGIPAVRVSLEAGGPSRGGLIVRLLQTLMLPRIGRMRLLRVRNAGLNVADWFWGLGVPMNETNLMDTLRGLRPGVNEIMCHPGARDEELAALTSDSVRAFIEENGIRLASFADAWE
jgi:chitin disaccharide deacetylase